MKRLTVRSCVIPVTSALCLVAALRLPAQTTAPASAGATKDDEPVLVLSPFVVEATEDSGYTAKDTLAGTRVRTELRDTSSSISVVTQKFLQDTGVKNAEDLLVYTPNTEVSGLNGNFSGQGGASVYQERTISQTTRVRGLDAADNTRDYFQTDIPFDTFNVGRVDLQRGANSILFGVGSPGGIINTSLNPASFKTAFKLENVTSSHGSQRNLVDLNYAIIPQLLSIRFAALNDQKRYRQEPAFNNDTRYYAALRFDPKIFNGEGSHTSIRANYEYGKIKSNNPRTLPPEDLISPWFQTGTDAYGNPGLNKLTVNEYSPGSGNNSPLLNSTYNKGGWRQGRTDWPTALSYFENGNGTPTNVIAGQITTGWRIDSTGAISVPINPGTGNVGINGLPNYKPQSIVSYQQYAGNTPSIPGGSYYADVVLTDPSIFDFYNLLLDGDNKREWQNWNAYSLALSQTFFNDRLGFELAYNNQSYTNGQVGFLQGVNYAINIDVNQVLSDGSANPNVGRPNVAYSAAAANNSSTIKRNATRLTAYGDFRAEDFLGKTTLAKILGRHVFTGLYNIENKEQTDVSWSQYASDLGWEALNNEQLNTKISNYRQFDWVNYIGPSLASAASAANAHLDNIKTIVAPPNSNSVKYFNSHWNKPTNPNDPGYVPPGASSAPTASATPVGGWIRVGPQVPIPEVPATSTTPLIPATVGYNYYNPQGYYAAGHSAADAAAAYAANPSAPLIPIYSYLGSNTGVAVTDTQSNNPANYVGWQNTPINWLSANNPQQFPDLVTGGRRLRFKDTSKALIWQGYFFDNDLAVTYGWRKDDISNYATSAPVDANTGVTALHYGTDLTSKTTISGQTRTYGAVYHIPKAITSHLPGGTGLSFFYNQGHNFKADAPRTDLSGNTLANPSGETKEYGVTITTLDDKLSLKIAKYKTIVSNATFNVTNGNSIAGLGGNGYWLWAAPAWGYGYAANLQYGMDGNFGLAGGPQGNNWNYAFQDLNAAGASSAQLAAVADPNGAGFLTSAQGILEKQIVAAWLALPVSDVFFNYFGINPAINPAAAHSSGKLYNAFSNFAAGGSVGSQQPGAINSVSTVDNVSKGTEFELSAQPTKNWNVTINYSKTDATKQHIDPTTIAFMEDNFAFFSGPGGQLRLWGVNGQAIGPNWIQNVYNPYLVSALATGQSAAEVSPWRLNGVTSYAFDNGAFKGGFVGGAVRLEAGRIIGYEYNPATLGLDVSKPFIGKNDSHFDLWVGYNKKLNSKIKWRIQLNLRNVGEKESLVAARYQPNGSLALARIQEGMSWQLTNSFEF